MTIRSRRSFLGNMAGAAAGAMGVRAFGALAAPRKRVPNFVFILVDDLGWADCGCYGSTFHETPNIDALAKRGVRFTNAYAAAPVCTATRASIMTGKWPARLHNTGANLPPIPAPDGRYPSPDRKGPPWAELVVPRPNGILHLGEVTIAEALKSHGYATASIGKWHLGEEAEYPEYQGFDFNVGGFNKGSTSSHFSPYGIPTLADGPEGEYLADRLTREAESFIEQHRDAPFFLYLSHYAVHTPIEAKEGYVEYFEPKADPDEGQRNPEYAAMIRSVDDSVGRIAAKLEALDIAENTVVIVMSDNGGMPCTPGDELLTSNAPLRAGKGSLYEGGIRTPMIVVWPGETQQGGTCDTAVSSVDFYPTMLEMAGLADVPRHESDGISFVPALKGETLARDTLFWHFPSYVKGFPEYFTSPCAAIRQGDLKLIKFFEGRAELYDLAADLGETNDLADVRPEAARTMEAELDAWLEEIQAQMPVPNPAYRPGFVSAQALDDFDPLGHELLRAWTFGSDSGGWEALQACTVAAQDGQLRVVAHGEGSQLGVSLSEPRGVFTVQIRLRSEVDTRAFLYWRSAATKGYHVTRRVAFRRIPGDGTWRTYAVRFTTEAPLRALRLDPFKGAGRAAIAWVRIYR